MKILKKKINGRNIVWVALIRTWKQFLSVDLVRYLVAYPRYFVLAKILGRMKTFKGDANDAHPDTIEYNKRAVSGVAVVRSNQLIKPLSIIDPIYNNLEDLKVLSLGPRAEGEILNLVAHGFSLKNIRGLDLFSYSPWIDVGDMHKMPYKDSSFDVIVNGWCISYSHNPKKAAEEMLRVAKDGAIFAIGISYHTPEQINKVYSRLKKEHGEEFGSLKHMQSVQELIGLFEDSVGEVFLRQDLNEHGKKKGQNFLTIFQIKK